jgi:transcriptional regulator with XRE-family HTH domain
VARPTNTTELDGMGKRIAALRHEAGLSQARLAAELGIAPSSIALYEIDQNRPALEQLIKLADFFDTSTDALLGREPIPVRDVERQAMAALRQVPQARRKLALDILTAMKD